MVYVVTTGKQKFGFMVYHDENHYFIIFYVILYASFLALFLYRVRIKLKLHTAPSCKT